MKKTLSLLLLLFLFIKGAFSQTISPDPATEFCPGTDITFTVSVPGTNPSVASWINGPIVVQSVYNKTTSGGSTTFNFKGRFQDKNLNQVFQISYKDADNNDAYYYPSFKKIKSLYFDNTSTPTSCFPIQPGQSSISAPLCQISNIPISFDNIKMEYIWRKPGILFRYYNNV